MSYQSEEIYWDKAAADPNVERNFISDVSVGDCLRQIQPNIRFGKVLEIGCGIGRLTTELSRRGDDYEVYGIDISSKMLDLAPKSSVKYRTCDGRRIPYADEMFDSVYSMLVFQHIPDSAKAGYIKEAARVLKSGGIFLVQAVLGDHHADIDHGTTPDDMAAWFRDSGFAVETTKRDPERQQWLWITGVKQ